jgi:hypothetical protein
MAYLHQNHQIQGGAEQRKHHHRYSNPVLVKPVHGRSDSGAHREGAYPNHKPEAVNSGKEGTDALKNRKKEAGPNDHALSAVIPGGRQLRQRSFESRWLRENG